MPKGWVEKNNLKKGDLISINDEGFELVLSANQKEGKPDAKDIDINSKGKGLDLLKAEIISSYLNGYDTINILFDHHINDAPTIKEIIRNLSGLEIMEQTSSRIAAKNLINVNEISIKNIIRRMDIITRAMMEDSILCCRGHCMYDSIHHRDVDVNRLYFLGCRATKHAMENPRIAKSLGIDPWHLHSDTLIIMRIEKIADRQKRIARYLCTSNLGRETLAELDNMHSQITEAYNNVMKAYYNQDKQEAIKIEVTNKDRTASCDKLLEKYTLHHTNSKSKTMNSNLVAVAKIIENLKATAAEIRNIARTVLCYE
ncbi:phosphate uptake regulator PhoU [Candidatus Woesearchaeota archaeon]|nr:phosphate uptake regulator PhoU [Candidatus Woesearchaeota archaeon]